MKVSDFKLEKVRKEFVVEINGELEKVTVYNILNEEREEIRLQLEDIIEGKTEHTLDAEDIEDIYNILFFINKSFLTITVGVATLQLSINSFTR